VNPANGGVRTLLRLEGAAVLILAAGAYAQCGAHGWGFFAAFFLVPDVSLAGHLAGPSLGARIYNTFHTYLAPFALLCVGALTTRPVATDLALIWVAHIGMDRAFGYGLKYSSGFADTHLGRIGRR